MLWEKANDIQLELGKIIKELSFNHVRTKRVFCFRTFGSKSRSYARIWSFPKIFQKALNINPAYVLEVISERFDKISEDKKTKILIHELLHIPKNFSGSLLPHRYGNKRIDREVERLYRDYADNNPRR